MYRASNTFPGPIVPTPSPMPLYDPKGTRWASIATEWRVINRRGLTRPTYFPDPHHFVFIS